MDVQSKAHIAMTLHCSKKGIMEHGKQVKELERKKHTDL